MSRNYTYIRHSSGEVDMLACRHRSDLPPERQQWGGIVHESVRDTNEIKRAIAAYGIVASELVKLDNGNSATLIEDTGDFDRLRQSFGYVLRLSPDAGLDIMGRDTDALKDIFGPDSHDHGLNADSWALCVIKPDAKKLGMEEAIIDEIQGRGLRVRNALANLTLASSHLNQLWPAPLSSDGTPLPTSPWWGATVAYMTEAPVDVVLVSGNNTSTTMKQIKADFRVDLYGEDYQSNYELSYAERVKSVIHTSDCNTELITNVAAFWPSSEIETITRNK